MTADTELFGIRGFHAGIKTAPEDDAGAKAEQQQRTQRQAAWPAPPAPDPQQAAGLFLSGGVFVFAHSSPA
ncbi:hypothetical protein D3C71_1955750 [compost metagenome]